MSRLWGTRCYMIGAMDRAPDCGIEWRRWLKTKLEPRGIVCLDPSDKPIDKGFEGISTRDKRDALIKEGKYAEVAREVKLLRVIDLRMVDLADFIICYIDTDIFAWGTAEEFDVANKTKKPILVCIKGGKENVPHWMLGQISHEHIFGNWDDLLEYIRHVDEDEDPYHYKRWTWFKYNEMLPQGTNKTSSSYDNHVAEHWSPYDP